MPLGVRVRVWKVVRLGGWCSDAQFETGLGWGACDKCVVLRLWVGRVRSFLYLFIIWGGRGGVREWIEKIYVLQSTMTLVV